MQLYFPVLWAGAWLIHIFEYPDFAGIIPIFQLPGRGCAKQQTGRFFQIKEVDGNQIKTMTNTIKNKESDKILLIYAIVYSVITLFFITEIKRDQSASLGYVFIFPIFWIIAGILLILLFRWTNIKIQTITDKISLLLSTPMPI